MDNKDNTRSGLLYGLSAFLLWGLFPIYFKQLNELAFIEIVAHRIVWSVLFLYILLKFSKRLNSVKQILSNKKTAFLLLVSGSLIATNWTIYIYGVSADKIIDTSLGYFINPLVTMMLGVIILKEKVSKPAKIAIAIVMLAICIQIYDVGGLPFISVVLPISFAIYSLVRKQIKVPSLEGLFIETFLIAPLAITALFFMEFDTQSSFSFSWFGLFIALSGPATVIPLLLFNSAAIRLNLSTLGYLQYISPSLQLLIAVFLYKEPINTSKIISFLLIWTALAIVSFSSIYANKSKNLV